MAESSRSVRDREHRGALLVPLRNQAPTQSTTFPQVLFLSKVLIQVSMLANVG